MATIKSYTDISQSKKLAEILPIESADMCLTFVNNIWNPVWGKADDIYQLQKDCYEPDYTKDEYVDFDEFEPKVIPCWSLAALINMLNTINDWYPGIDAQVGKENYWQICMFSYNTGSDENKYAIEKELVDCCYEVIIKCKEQKLL